MKVSGIDDAFRERYLSNPADPEAFEGKAVVFEGPEDYHDRINDPALGDRRATACCSSATAARSAIPARPRW